MSGSNSQRAKKIPAKNCGENIKQENPVLKRRVLDHDLAIMVAGNRTATT